MLEQINGLLPIGWPGKLRAGLAHGFDLVPLQALKYVAHVIGEH